MRCSRNRSNPSVVAAEALPAAVEMRDRYAVRFGKSAFVIGAAAIIVAGALGFLAGGRRPGHQRRRDDRTLFRIIKEIVPSRNHCKGGH
jgi:hypothetical protein